MAKKNMQVVLRQEVSKLGKTGDVVGVTPGYARNYLFPQGLAERMTPGVLKTVELRRAQEEQRKLEEKKLADSKKTALEIINNFVVQVKVGEGDAIFGTVTNQDIADVIKQASGQEVDRRNIQVDDIKQTGEYPVEIKLHPEVTATIRLQVNPA
ncbi:MAG: 50S ribosomal protein L9 [Cyanobacteria bacterium P01_A01_bin.3]